MLSQLLNSLQAQTQAYTYGDHPSPYLGDGIEKSETRAYTHGDSLKHINWKQSIKVQKRQTNRYQKEQHFDIHVYADINANRTEGYRHPFIKDLDKLRTTIRNRSNDQHHHLTLYTPNNIYSILNRDLTIQTFMQAYRQNKKNLTTMSIKKTLPDCSNKIIIYLTGFIFWQQEDIKQASFIALHNITIGIQIPLYTIGRNYTSYDDISSPTLPILHHHFILST